MSHPVNTEILEQIYAQFKSSKDGRERSYLLWRLKEDGFDSERTSLIQDWYKERKEWLGNTKEDEVLFDEEGQCEYIMVEPTLMDDGDEPEDARMKKVIVPDYLDVEHWVHYDYPWKNLRPNPWS